MEKNLLIYNWLHRGKLGKSYLLKFQLTAFVGTHLPLLFLIGYLLWSGSFGQTTSITVIAVTLLATLLGASITLWLQKQLILPVLATAEALQQYQIDKTIPQLPTHFNDEAGVLMANTRKVITDLDELLRARVRFMATLSHDIRSPLGAIMILSDLIDAKVSGCKCKSTTVRDDAFHIKRIAEDQLMLMNNMLELVKAETKSIVTKPVQTTLSDLFENVERTARPIATYKQVNFRTEYEPEVAFCMVLLLDLPKTVQVLNNLVLNAIKFVPEQGGEVVLGVTKRPQEVLFYVRDNGVGFDAARYHESLAPFTSLSRKGTANEIGTGLGLWICKVFTEAQGGRLEVTSEINRGSCFSVTIPQPEKVV